MNIQGVAIFTAAFLSCEIYCSSFTPHGYLTTAVTESWESLVFWITNSISPRGSACARHSQWYCLDAYHTPDPRVFGGTLMPNFSNRSGLLEPHAAKAWFELLIREQWVDINMINFANPRDCCSNQVSKYMLFGLLHKMIKPDKYLAMLTDYKNESKPLNFLMAVYLPTICSNVIIEVGFGPGNFRRSHQPTVVEGAPYVILGRELEDAGLRHMASAYFNYSTVDQELTFHWFKHNIMCRDNAWICDETLVRTKGHKSPGASGEKKDNGGASGSGSKKGGKKARRKKQQANQGKTEFRRRLS